MYLESLNIDLWGWRWRAQKIETDTVTPAGTKTSSIELKAKAQYKLAVAMTTKIKDFLIIFSTCLLLRTCQGKSYASPRLVLKIL